MFGFVIKFLLLALGIALVLYFPQGILFFIGIALIYVLGGGKLK